MEILDAVPVLLTAIVGVYCPRIKNIATTRCPIRLHPLLQQCQYCPKNHTTPCNRYHLRCQQPQSTICIPVVSVWQTTIKGRSYWSFRYNFVRLLSSRAIPIDFLLPGAQNDTTEVLLQMFPYEVQVTKIYATFDKRFKHATLPNCKTHLRTDMLSKPSAAALQAKNNRKERMDSNIRAIRPSSRRCSVKRDAMRPVHLKQ